MELLVKESTFKNFNFPAKVSYPVIFGDAIQNTWSKAFISYNPFSAMIHTDKN